MQILINFTWLKIRCNKTLIDQSNNHFMLKYISLFNLFHGPCLAVHHDYILPFKLTIKVSGWVLYYDPGQQVTADQIKIMDQWGAGDHVIIQQGLLFTSELVWILDQIKLYLRPMKTRRKTRLVLLTSSDRATAFQ